MITINISLVMLSSLQVPDFSECDPYIMVDSAIRRENLLVSGTAEFDLEIIQGSDYLNIDSPIKLRFSWIGRKKFSLSQITSQDEKLLIASDGKYVMTSGNLLWENAFLLHMHSPYRDKSGILDCFETELFLLTNIILCHLMPIGRTALITNPQTDAIHALWCFKRRNGGITPEPDQLERFLYGYLSTNDNNITDTQELNITMLSIAEPKFSVKFSGCKTDCTLLEIFLNMPKGTNKLEYVAEKTASQLPAINAHGNCTFNSHEIKWITKLVALGLLESEEWDVQFPVSPKTKVKLLDNNAVTMQLKKLEKQNLIDSGNRYIAFRWGETYDLNMLQRFDLAFRNFFFFIITFLNVEDGLSTRDIISIIKKYKEPDTDFLMISIIPYAYVLIIICICLFSLILFHRILKKLANFVKRNFRSNSGYE